MAQMYVPMPGAIGSPEAISSLIYISWLDGPPRMYHFGQEIVELLTPSQALELEH